MPRWLRGAGRQRAAPRPRTSTTGSSATSRASRSGSAVPSGAPVLAGAGRARLRPLLPRQAGVRAERSERFGLPARPASSRTTPAAATSTCATGPATTCATFLGGRHTVYTAAAFAILLHEALHRQGVRERAHHDLPRERRRALGRPSVRLRRSAGAACAQPRAHVHDALFAPRVPDGEAELPRSSAAEPTGSTTEWRSLIVTDPEQAQERRRAGAAQESLKERLEREHEELLHELRALIPGAQVLLGFLLAIRFTSSSAT